MAGISNASSDNLLAALLKATAYTGPATIYLSLHTNDPGITGANELTGGSYARQAIVFNTPLFQQTANNGPVGFSGLPIATVAYVGLWDAATNGNFLWAGTMTASIATVVGSAIQFATSAITARLS